MKKLALIICCYFISSSHTIYAQTCKTGAIKSTPDTNFEIIGDGSEVKDKITGLIWQRCFAGQIWNGSECIGEANQFQWIDALKETRKLGKGYRLPNAKEAMSIIEHSCIYPAFNTKIFMDGKWTQDIQLARPIWTSTPNGDNQVYAVWSGWGKLTLTAKNTLKGVRAVRGGW